MVITVEICQIVLDITKKKKINKKNVTMVLPLKEIIHHYNHGNLSNNFCGVGESKDTHPRMY